MSQEFLGGAVRLFHGDSREVLRAIPDNSIDSVCTDPPYALVSIVKRFGGPNAAPANDGDVYARASAGFMNQTWDTGETAFAVEFWADVMRVLKPGGHVIAASGTRTYHRLACAIEDAGFEIRDMVVEYIESDTFLRAFFASLNEEQQRAFVRMIDERMFGGMFGWVYGSGFPKSHNVGKGIDKALGGGDQMDIEAEQWRGWGTALKPACEPWVLARKPLIGTVASNVLTHGTGALNIDGCRVAGEKPLLKNTAGSEGMFGLGSRTANGTSDEGRFPANVIHDGSDEVVSAFPHSTSGAMSASTQRAAQDGPGSVVYGTYGGNVAAHDIAANSGTAARFYYSAKADAMDRIGSKHPTVKPVDLMQYLCRLITPPGGTVLDPFAGSGTTGEAAWREGFNAVLIEREAEFVADIRTRLDLAAKGSGSRRRAIAAKKPATPKADPSGQVEAFA